MLEAEVYASAGRMKAFLTDDIGAFLRKTQAFLEADEAANNLILGILAAQRDLSPDVSRAQSAFAWVESEDGTIATCALQTPPMFFVLVGAPEAAIRTLVPFLHAAGAKAPGVVGPPGEAAHFAREWCALSGQSTRLAMSQKLFRLDRVIRPRNPARGEMKIATLDDIEVAVDWQLLFFAEAAPEDPRSREQIAALAEKKILAGELFFWMREGKPVTMASWGRATARCARINTVFTPGALRGHGFASALTADLSQRLLDQGYKIVTLYTDSNNPTSNSIYQKLGYMPVGDSQVFLFEDHFRSSVQ